MAESTPLESPPAGWAGAMGTAMGAMFIPGDANARLGKAGNRFSVRSSWIGEECEDGVTVNVGNSQSKIVKVETPRIKPSEL